MLGNGIVMQSVTAVSGISTVLIASQLQGRINSMFNNSRQPITQLYFHTSSTGTTHDH